MKYKSIKVDRHTFRVPIPKKRMQLSANAHFAICNHKNRWIVALCEGVEHKFRTCNRLNRSEALKMIAFLSDYINLVGPTDATVLNASIRARTNGIMRDANSLTGLAVPHD